MLHCDEIIDTNAEILPSASKDAAYDGWIGWSSNAEKKGNEKEFNICSILNYVAVVRVDGSLNDPYFNRVDKYILFQFRFV